MLKNKFLIFSIPTLILFYLVAFKTSSFFLESVQGDTMELKTSQWQPAESSLVLMKDSDEYSIEEKIDLQNSTNKEQNFITTKNQYLSFQYKINSNENAVGFDWPNVLIKINDKLVFQDYVENDAWKRGFINLKNFDSNSGNYSLNFFTNNSFDDKNPPTLSLKDISTSRFLAKENDLLKFSVSKPNSSIILKYSIEEKGVIIEKQKTLSFPYEFQITEHFHDNNIEYFSVDSFGNIEESKFATVDTDFSAPGNIADARFFPESDSELSVTFTAPEDSFSNLTSFYEIVGSQSEIVQGGDWNLFEKLNLVNHKKFGDSSLPSEDGLSENILISNPNSNYKFFAIKSVDFAGNYSEISNIITLE